MRGDKESFFSLHQLDHLSDDCKDIIARMLSYDVTERITIEEIMRHAFFSQITLLKELQITKNRLQKRKSSLSGFEFKVEIKVPLTARKLESI